MIITIGGLPGSGKTTVAKKLAEKLNKEHVNAGDIFRNLAAKKGMTLEEFSAYADQNPNIDKAIDKKLVEIAKKGDVILEGRLAGIMAERNKLDALKVWLEAPLRVRAERVSKREGKSVETAAAEIRAREESEVNRYKDIYQVDLTNLSLYTMVINSASLTPDEIADSIIKRISAK